jgi:hypothetical protein
VGNALVKHPLIQKVDFTGGTATGRAIGKAAGENLCGYIAELGGKSPMVNGCAFEIPSRYIDNRSNMYRLYSTIKVTLTIVRKSVISTEW